MSVHKNAKRITTYITNDEEHGEKIAMLTAYDYGCKIVDSSVWMLFLWVILPLMLWRDMRHTAIT